MSKQPKTVQVFKLIRHADTSGVSGVGHILDGIIFHTGQTVVCWRTDVAGAKHGHSSIGIYDTFEAFCKIHIHSHPANKSEIVFCDFVEVAHAGVPALIEHPPRGG